MNTPSNSSHSGCNSSDYFTTIETIEPIISSTNIENGAEENASRKLECFDISRDENGNITRVIHREIKSGTSTRKVKRDYLQTALIIMLMVTTLFSTLSNLHNFFAKETPESIDGPYESNNSNPSEEIPPPPDSSDSSSSSIPPELELYLTQELTYDDVVSLYKESAESNEESFKQYVQNRINDMMASHGCYFSAGGNVQRHYDQEPWYENKHIPTSWDIFTDNIELHNANLLANIRNSL